MEDTVTVQNTDLADEFIAINYIYCEETALAVYSNFVHTSVELRPLFEEEWTFHARFQQHILPKHQ
jgi:hypothetical protein